MSSSSPHKYKKGPGVCVAWMLLVCERLYAPGRGQKEVPSEVSQYLESKEGPMGRRPSSVYLVGSRGARRAPA